MLPSRDVGIPLRNNSHKEQHIQNAVMKSPTLPPPKSLKRVMSLEPALAFFLFFFSQREVSVIYKRKHHICRAKLQAGGDMESWGPS